jgi:hypothetical protein
MSEGAQGIFALRAAQKAARGKIGSKMDRIYNTIFDPGTTADLTPLQLQGKPFIWMCVAFKTELSPAASLGQRDDPQKPLTKTPKG